MPSARRPPSVRALVQSDPMLRWAKLIAQARANVGAQNEFSGLTDCIVALADEVMDLRRAAKPAPRRPR